MMRGYRLLLADKIVNEDPRPYHTPAVGVSCWDKLFGRKITPCDSADEAEYIRQHALEYQAYRELVEENEAEGFTTCSLEFYQNEPMDEVGWTDTRRVQVRRGRGREDEEKLSV